MNVVARRLSTVATPTWGRRFLGDYYAPDAILNDDNMLKTVSRFQAMPRIRMATHEPTRKAAVLIPLCLVNGKVSLLYTLRASNLRLHKGQVSFPGGMQDAKDRSINETALRETQEELGIEPRNIKVWGMGNPIIARADTSVVPVIGTLEEELDVSTLKVNPSEVEEVFTVSLEDLCQSDMTGYTQFKVGYSTPVFYGAKRRIWGLTAVITNAFLRCLLPPNAYTHKIRFLPQVKPMSKRLHDNR